MERNNGMYVHPVMMMILVAAVAVMLTVLYMRHPDGIGSSSPVIAQDLPQAVATAHPVSGKQLYYSPMHPWIVQDHPGTCPICGMDLVEMPPEDQAVFEANHPEMT